MPYSVNDDNLPEAVKNLSTDKKKQWVAAFNAAFKQYEGDEGKAFATAWAAIKKAFDAEDLEKENLEKVGRRHSKTDVGMIDEMVSMMGKVMSMMRDLRGGEDTGESEDEDEQMKGDREQAREAQRRRAAKYGITPGGNVTKPGEWAGVPDSDWGDPVRYAYPMPDEAHEMAAMKYFNHSDQQSGGNYNDREWAIIGRRIAQHLGEGYAYRDGKIVNTSEKGEKITLTAALFKADPDKQLCYGVVLKPAPFVDTQDDILTEDEIEKAAHKYMEDYRRYDLQHEEDVSKQKAIPVESYIAPQDLVWDFGKVKKTVPKGSWVLVTHVKDTEIWKGIKEGRVNAYSIVGTGYRREVEEE